MDLGMATNVRDKFKVGIGHTLERWRGWIFAAKLRVPTNERDRGGLNPRINQGGCQRQPIFIGSLLDHQASENPFSATSSAPSSSMNPSPQHSARQKPSNHTQKESSQWEKNTSDEETKEIELLPISTYVTIQSSLSIGLESNTTKVIRYPRPKIQNSTWRIHPDTQTTPPFRRHGATSNPRTCGR